MKVGDKVLILTDISSVVKKGDICTVTYVYPGGDLRVNTNSSDIFVYPDEIRVIPSIADIWGEE